MILPLDYLEIVSNATAALRAVSPRTRAAAEGCPEEPARWLQARNLESLADRLEFARKEDWQTVAVTLFILGTDLGVLDDCLDGQSRDAPEWAHTLSFEERLRLTRLREFLSDLLAGYFAPLPPAV